VFCAGFSSGLESLADDFVQFIGQFPGFVEDVGVQAEGLKLMKYLVLDEMSMHLPHEFGDIGTGAGDRPEVGSGNTVFTLQVQ
jgi:hypothetical protein